MNKSHHFYLAEWMCYAKCRISNIHSKNILFEVLLLQYRFRCQLFRIVSQEYQLSSLEDLGPQEAVAPLAGGGSSRYHGKLSLGPPALLGESLPMSSSSSRQITVSP